MIKELVTMLQEVDPVLLDKAKERLHGGGKVFFVGNGGSAAIASHMAVDYTKNGGVAGISLNDPAMLTCVANDYGYEEVFSRQLQWRAEAGDTVVLISSSGKSANIINAALAAHDRDCQVITLTGFTHDNPLRKMGAINFYVPSHDYGVVEITHLAILHSMVKA